MAEKVVRTVYLSEEMDDYITKRMLIEDRKRSSLVERLLRKCIEFEKNRDISIAKESE